MVQILPKVSSFGEQLGSRLGGGFEQGLSKGFEFGQKVKQEKTEQKGAIEFGKQMLEKYPDSPEHQMLGQIYTDPNLSMDRKSEMAKNLVGVDPYKFQQQQRLQQDMIRKAYDTRIKEEQNRLNKAARFKDKEAIEGNITNLQFERDELLGIGKDRPHAEKPEMKEEEEETEEFSKKRKKTKFDKKNKEHIAKYNQIKKKFAGDQKRINAELSKEFEL